LPVLPGCRGKASITKLIKEIDKLHCIGYS
jgi:hypothetical protein